MALIVVIKSTIRTDGFVVSIDRTNFGLLGGTVKVALVMLSNLLLDIVHMPPSAVAMLNGTGDSGYSIAFSSLITIPLLTQRLTSQLNISLLTSMVHCLLFFSIFVDLESS